MEKGSSVMDDDTRSSQPPAEGSAGVNQLTSLSREHGLSLLRAELDISQVFAGRALQASDDAARERNLHYAHMACDAVASFMARVDLTCEEKANLSSGLANLRNVLVNIQKRLPSSSSLY